jgi:hypothetical protein
MKLKTLYSRSVILLILSSCKQSNIESKQTNVITIRDSCEYIFADWNNKTVLLYKDSCVECRESVKKTWKSYTILQKTNRFNSLNKQD